jgi:hypothetical protein
MIIQTVDVMILLSTLQLVLREKEIDATRHEVQGLVSVLEGALAGDKEELKKEAHRCVEMDINLCIFDVCLQATFT